jgi:hypothetical protein
MNVGTENEAAQFHFWYFRYSVFAEALVFPVGKGIGLKLVD